MKIFIASIIYYLLNSFILKFPSRKVRLFFLKIVLGKIGIKTNFLRFVEIRVAKNVYLGNNSVINQKVLLDGRGGKILIGDNVDIAQETNIWTLSHDPNDDFHREKGGDVVIEDFVWIASRVTILPNVRIGRGAVVACNSVVTKDIPEMTIVAGIPAKIIGLRKSKLLYNLNYRPFLR